MFTRFFFLSVLFLGMFSVVAVESAADEAVQKIRLMTNWLPQAEFAATYVAEAKGFFAKQLPHCKVEVLPTSFKDRVYQKLTAGDIDFCMMWFPDALLLNQKDKPVVCLQQIAQRTPMMLVMRKDLGFKTPRDLNGKRVQQWQNEFGFMMRAFFERNNIKPIAVPQNESMLPFIFGAVPVACALDYNEYHTLLERGIPEEELQTFRLSDYGLDFPGNGVYCLKTYREKHPDICRGITQAIYEGWKFAAQVENEAETLAIIMKQTKDANVVTSKSHQRWMLKKYLPNVEIDAEPWGELKRSDFDRILNIIKESKKIQLKKDKRFPTYEEFFVKP